MRPAPLLALALAALAAAAPPRPALAHHCFPDVFDANAPRIIRGKVIAVEWVNPHALIYVTGPATGPRTQAPMTAVFWAGTPNGLIRSGLTRETLKAGAQVVIRGYQAKDRSCPAHAVTGTATCLLEARDLAFIGDDRRYFIGSTGHNAPPDQLDRAEAARIEPAEAPLGVAPGFCPPDRAAASARPPSR